jgi:hypothetical protein
VKGPLVVPDRDRVRVVRVLGLPNECQSPTRVERRIGECFEPERDTGDGDDADALVLPANAVARRRVTQEEPALSALEPKAQPLGQNSSSLRTAAETRSGEGMYASSICQYGYGTSYPVTRTTGPRRSSIAFSARTAATSAA